MGLILMGKWDLLKSTNARTQQPSKVNNVLFVKLMKLAFPITYRLCQ